MKEVFGIYGKIYFYGYGLLAVRTRRMGAYHKLLNAGLNRMVKNKHESIFSFKPERIKEVAQIIKAKKQKKEIQALVEMATPAPANFSPSI